MKKYLRFICAALLFLSSIEAASAKNSKITFSADELLGSGKKDNTSTTLIGNAVVTVDSFTIRGDRIELYGKDYRYVKATGSLTGEDTEKGFSFSADSLKYDRETEIAEFLGSAKVDDTKNEVTTEAERIKYNQKNETILLQMAVKLVSKDIECTSLFALYNRNTSLLKLTGQPTVKKDNDSFKAGKILVNLDTEDIRLEEKVSGSVTEEEKAAPQKKEKKSKTDNGKKTQPPQEKSETQQETPIKPANKEKTEKTAAGTEKEEKQAKDMQNDTQR